jgi:hypothetical protein
LSFLLILALVLNAPCSSIAQANKTTKATKTGKSNSSRGASKRKMTKAAKKGRSKKRTGASAIKRKKPVVKAKTAAKTPNKGGTSIAKTTAPAAKKTKVALSENNVSASAPRYANNNGAPSDVAYGSARSNPNTVSNSTSVSPSEPVSIRSVLEKTDQEVLQELFGFDGSNRDTAFMSPYWLGQMRFTIPEQYAKIFPKESLYEEGKPLTIYDMDATQRILPISSQYEGYVVTPHKDPKNYYLYLYSRAQKRMLTAPNKVASEYSTTTMHYKTYSYVFEDLATGKLKMMACTRSARLDLDTCTANCVADYRIDGYEFNGASWQTKYTIQQSRSDAKVTSSSVSCGDASLRAFLEGRANTFVSYYFRKKE